MTKTIGAKISRTLAFSLIPTPLTHFLLSMYSCTFKIQDGGYSAELAHYILILHVLSSYKRTRAGRKVNKCALLPFQIITCISHMVPKSRAPRNLFQLNMYSEGINRLWNSDLIVTRNSSFRTRNGTSLFLNTENVIPFIFWKGKICRLK